MGQQKSSKPYFILHQPPLSINNDWSLTLLCRQRGTLTLAEGGLLCCRVHVCDGDRKGDTFQFIVWSEWRV